MFERIKRVTKLALVAGLSAASIGAIASDAVTADGANAPVWESDYPVPKNPKILGFVVPDYPSQQRTENRSGEVDLAIRVRADGTIASFKILSPDSPFDAPLREVIPMWIAIPSGCSKNVEDHRQLRLKVVFSAEDGHYYVAIRDSRYEDVPRSADASAEPPEARKPFEHPLSMARPLYPRKAISANTYGGLTIARFTVGQDGNVFDVQVPFSYPRAYFIEATRKAILQWTFPPSSDVAPRTGCVEVNYHLSNY